MSDITQQSDKIWKSLGCIVVHRSKGRRVVYDATDAQVFHPNITGRLVRLLGLPMTSTTDEVELAIAKWYAAGRPKDQIKQDPHVGGPKRKDPLLEARKPYLVHLIRKAEREHGIKIAS